MHFKPRHHCVFEEDSCQLSMGEGKSPESEIRGGVGNCTKHEFNSFNQLVDQDVCEGNVVLAT